MGSVPNYQSKEGSTATAGTQPRTGCEAKEDAREINALLDATTLRLNKIYNKLLENNEHITAKRIKDIYIGKDEKRKTLLEAFTDHNQMMASRVGVDFQNRHIRGIVPRRITSRRFLSISIIHKAQHSTFKVCDGYSLRPL